MEIGVRLESDPILASISFSDTYVDYLCKTSDTVVMTAAGPGQGGTDHVNEQPKDYWIAKFQARGLTLDSKLSPEFSAEWRAAGVADFYYQNLMIFRRAQPANSTSDAGD